MFYGIHTTWRKRHYAVTAERNTGSINLLIIKALPSLSTEFRVSKNLLFRLGNRVFQTCFVDFHLWLVAIKTFFKTNKTLLKANKTFFEEYKTLFIFDKTMFVIHKILFEVDEVFAGMDKILLKFEMVFAGMEKT